LRKAILHVPDEHNGPLPLVLMLHGTGGTAAWTLEETGWAQLADQEGFLLLVPEGTRADITAPPGFLKNPLVWNDGSNRPGLGQPNSDDVAYLDHLLDAVVAEYPADPQRIFCTGFSNGAGMAFRLASERGERFAGLAPVAGLCSVAAPRPAVAVPTIFLSGTLDPLVPVAGGAVRLPWTNQVVHRPPVRATLDRWAQALHCSPVPVVLEERDGVRIEAYPSGEKVAEFQVWWIEGQGHHWPGGRGGVSQRLCGPITNHVHANTVIWRFFQSVTARDRPRRT
jgi:polyhydroxybutyrate depolymerase